VVADTTTEPAVDTITDTTNLIASDNDVKTDLVPTYDDPISKQPLAANHDSTTSTIDTNINFVREPIQPQLRPARVDSDGGIDIPLIGAPRVTPGTGSFSHISMLTVSEIDDLTL